MTVAQLAAALNATVVGDNTAAVSGVAMVEHVSPGTVTYAVDARYLERATAGHAAAVIVGRDLGHASIPLLQVDAPKVAFAQVIELFYPREVPPPGIHATAVIAEDAQVAPSCTVGPQVVVGANAHIGAHTVLHAGVHVGAGTVVGAECELFDHVVLYSGVALGDRVRIHAHTTVGADGFGYAFDGSEHRKIPQVGTVEIGNDVEIGAGVCIDRGTLGPTRIGTGARIDNLVQIGHNVQVGDYAILVSQVGIAGSATVGKFAVLGGQVGVGDGVTIGAGAQLAAATKLAKDVGPGEIYVGMPGRPRMVVGRQLAALSRLPDALKRLRRLEKLVEAWEARHEGLSE